MPTQVRAYFYETISISQHLNYHALTGVRRVRIFSRAVAIVVLVDAA